MSLSAKAKPDGATAIRRVNDTLKGPVADVLRQILPELAVLPRAEIYDRVLDDLGLLQRCFDAFRRERPRFRHILVDDRYRPVQDDNTQLCCGRSLNEVVAMVVRSAAKRHFRRVLDGGWGVGANVVPLRPDLSGRHQAAQLYQAIKDVLMHEWQLPLVPTYATLSPAQIGRLGPRLLEIRDSEKLRQLILAPEPPAAPAPVPAASGPTMAAVRADRIASLLSDDGIRLRVEAFASALLRPDVRKEMPEGGNGIRLTDALRDVGGSPARLLLCGLQLSPEQLAVILINARARMANGVFQRVFGPPGQPELVLRVIQRALDSGIGPEASLGQCAAFTRELFARGGGSAQAGNG